MSPFMINKFKYSIIVLLIGIMSFLGGCNYDDNCTSKNNCFNKIETAIDKNQTQKALNLYKKYLQYSEQQNIYLLNLIANETLKEIYNGKIKYSNKINILLTIDTFYTRAGIPFLREKLGTKKFSQSIEDKNKVSKAIAAMFLYSKDNYKYTDGIQSQLKDPQPVIRGCTAAALSSIKDSKRYLPVLKNTFLNDEQLFVRNYALKGLGLNDYETYKKDILETYKSNDFLGKIIAAGVMLYNKDKTGIDTIKEGLNSTNSIANLRAIEALLLNNLLIEEKTILDYLNSNDLAKNYMAARLLAKNITPEYKSMLIENLKHKDFNKQFSASIALLELNDKSGLEYILKALDEEELILRIFAANAIIKHYNKTLENEHD